MAVVSVISGSAKPGKQGEVVDIVREMRANNERLSVGLRGVRLYQSFIGGALTGRLYATTTYDDFESWGKSIERSNEDEQAQALVQRAAGADSPVQDVTRLMLQDRDRDQSREYQIGPVLQMTDVQIKPGRASDVAGLRDQVRDLGKQVGALDYRPMDYVFDGQSAPGRFIAMFYHDSIEALGKAIHKQYDDPDWAQFVTTMTASDAPIEYLGSRILVEIPL